MKTLAALILAAAILGNLAPLVAADPISDAISTVNGILSGPPQYPLVMPGFSHKVCEVLTGGSCGEGDVLPTNVQCSTGADGSETCNATNCSGSGAAYTCTLTYTYRVCISNVGIDPNHPAQSPLYVNAYGYADHIPGMHTDGILSHCVESDPASIPFSNIPVQGKDVNISAFISVAIGPVGSTEYQNGTTWYTVAIHLPGPQQAALLDTKALVGDPTGTLLAAGEGADATAMDYATSYEGWNPSPVTLYPGPVPDVEPIPVPPGPDGLPAQVMVMVESVLP